MSASSAASTLTRNRFAVIACIVVSLGGLYYAIDTVFADTVPVTEPANSGLHRSNAVHRRPRRRTTSSNHESETLVVDSSADNDGDAETIAHRVDAETLVDESAYQDDYSWTEQPISNQRNGHNIVQLLFRVSEDATRRNAYIHRGCACNACGVMPIRGVRYRCSNCADYDLCETCEAQDPHYKTHIFYKVKVPASSFRSTQMQPIWYAGNPDDPSIHHTLPKELITKLSRETGLERPELDAYWEQWTYMANTEWREDPDALHLAMDRRTFERSLVPAGGKYSAPSLIFDRMFAFYDSNKDDLISFSEFLHGLVYRKKKDKWGKIFDAYDIDGDGYVCRKDFLRIFRSYYVLYRRIHQDLVESEGMEQMSTSAAHKLVTGRQPLSAAFGIEGRYPGALPNSRTGEGKTAVSNGDLEISDGKGVVRESGSDTGNREDVIRACWTSPSRERYYGRGYWDAMVNPPTTVEQMPEVLRNLNRNRGWNATAESIAAEARRDGMPNPFAESNDSGPSIVGGTWPPTNVTITDEDVAAVVGAGTSIADVPPMYQPLVTHHAYQRRDNQKEIHNRWKRRQFYTDEEEGAGPPSDWKDTEDIVGGMVGESSSMINSRHSLHSRSSSKVRFAEDFEDFDTRSNHSNSSRSIPERWGGMEIPDAEKDAGKEILYQVTQQALNELLDPLFRPKESLAIQAAESKDAREKWRHVFSTSEFERVALEMGADKNKKESKGHKFFLTTRNPVWPSFTEVEVEHVRERPLDVLLAATEYLVETNEDDGEDGLGPLESFRPPRPSRDVLPGTILPTRSLSRSSGARFEDILGTVVLDIESDASVTCFSSPDVSSPAINYDSTMPQFRPNASTPTSDSVRARSEASPSEEHMWPLYTPISTPGLPSDHEAEEQPGTSSSGGPAADIEPSNDIQPSNEVLYDLWKLDKADKEAAARGGWGRLDMEEFVRGVKEGVRNGRGAQMDYLGSWIEFCIPY